MDMNRRNLFAAAVLPLVGYATPALAGVERRAIPAGATGDAEWNRLHATYRAAEAEEAETLRVFGALDDAWSAGKATREPEPIAPSLGPIDKSLTLSELVAQTDAPAWKATWAAYEAERAVWEACDEAAYAAFVGDTGDRYEAASDACSAAVTALMGHPVATLSALVEKAELILTRYGDTVDGDDAKALIADIRRLSAGEA